jgi:hypothetical protein
MKASAHHRKERVSLETERRGSVGKEYLYKVLVVGCAATGKTSLIRRTVDGNFSGNYKSTIGVDFALKSLERDQHKIFVQLWDIAGTPLLLTCALLSLLPCACFESCREMDEESPSLASTHIRVILTRSREIQQLDQGLLPRRRGRVRGDRRHCQLEGLVRGTFHPPPAQTTVPRLTFLRSICVERKEMEGGRGRQGEAPHRGPPARGAHRQQV